jgi:hypothetical protein
MFANNFDYHHEEDDGTIFPEGEYFIFNPDCILDIKGLIA